MFLPWGVFHPACFLAVSHFLVPLGSFEVDLPQLVIPELSWGWLPQAQGSRAGQCRVPAVTTSLLQAPGRAR